MIARICKSDVFYNSYIELPVKCVDDAESEILGAYYAEDVNNGTLYVLFSTGTYFGLHNLSIGLLCVFSSCR